MRKERGQLGERVVKREMRQERGQIGERVANREMRKERWILRRKESKNRTQKGEVRK